MMQEIDRFLDEGTALQARGDLVAAEDRYRRALALDAEHLDALQLLGGLKIVQGDLDAAQGYLEKAVARAPGAAMLRINLAAVHLKKGDPARALPEAQAAVAAEPQNPGALKQLAACAEHLGRTAEAAGALERLTLLRAATVETELRCARLFLAAGDAEKSFQAALRAARMGTEAHVDEVHGALAAAALAKRDWPELISIGLSWVEQAPKLIEAHELLSQAYLQAGDTYRARTAYLPVFDIAGGSEPDPEHALNYGSLCLITQDFDEAEKYLRLAADAMPDNSRAAHAMARLHTFKGDLDAAAQACERAIELDPDTINPYVQLTTLRRGKIAPEMRERMDAIWRKGKGPKELLSPLGLALGDIAHKEERRDEAFEYYVAANRMCADLYALEGKSYEPRAMEEKIERLKHLFAQNATWTPEESDGAPELVFIVGMPRSGTTLAESIVAAHSRVFGAGEVLTGAKLLDDFLARAEEAPGRSLDALLAEQGGALRETYVRALPKWGEATHLTDKLPTNFLGIGLLASLFPRARFIHMRRDPLDTGFSVFRHSFPRAFDWAHYPADIGHFYGQYLKIMAFYEERFRDRITTIRYEDIPEAPERLVPEIVAAAGLDWEPQCAEFYTSKRPIATFSSVQVRSPISKSSIGVSASYRTQLQPFLEALERTGAWRP